MEGLAHQLQLIPGSKNVKKAMLLVVSRDFLRSYMSVIYLR